jgi:RNA polymerase sigma-70 factor, ECF subfamily
MALHDAHLMAPAPKLAPIPEDDALLVARAASGDERAFTAIYRRHARYVAGVAYRLFGEDSEVDDVVQETFVAASTGLASLAEGGALRPWLVTIAVRKVARRLERRQRQRWMRTFLGRVSPAAAAPVVEGEAFALYEALGSVSPERRVPWVLHVIEGLTLPEAADACGVSLATVKRRIQETSDLLARRGASPSTGGSHGR